MNIEKKLEYLIEEAEANLTIYNSGEDDYALIRYNSIMESVHSVQKIIEDKQKYDDIKRR